MYTFVIFDCVQFQTEAEFANNNEKDEIWSSSVILPDIDAKDLETFIQQLWTYHKPSDTGSSSDIASNTDSVYKSIERVLNTLCTDFKTTDSIISEKANVSQRTTTSPDVVKQNLSKKTSKKSALDKSHAADKENRKRYDIDYNDLLIVDTTKKKSLRKRVKKSKEKISKPLVRKEVVKRNHRSETSYALRKSIKKVKFTDEVSGSSDIEDGGDENMDVSSMSESDEYIPEDKIKGAADNESDYSADNDIPDKNEEDLDEEESIEYENVQSETDEEDIFSIEYVNEKGHGSVGYQHVEEGVCLKDISNLTTHETAEVQDNMTMFTVKLCPDGTVEVLNQEDASKPLDPGYETAIALVGPTKASGYKDDAKMVRNHEHENSIKHSVGQNLTDEKGNVVGVGRVVQVMEEDGDSNMITTREKLIYSSERLINPRSLLKSKSASSADERIVDDSKDLKALPHVHPSSTREGKSDASKESSLMLLCSVCGYQCGSDGKLGGGQQAMRHHAAKKHPRSRFFVLPVGNPHRECAQCNALMVSYEQIVAEDPAISLKGKIS